MTTNSLIIFEDDDLIRAAETNDNNRYLENKVDTVSTSVNSYLQSQMQTLNYNVNARISALIEGTSTSIEHLNEFTEALDERIEALEQCSTPTKTALIDWEVMNFKANVSDVRNINNTTTGIKAYSGNNSQLHYGDIYLKEDFTNYPRLLIIWTDDSGTYLSTDIIETWLLDYMLKQTKGTVSLIKQARGAYYWNIYGYEYSQTISEVTYNTTKDFLFCNNNQNCGIVEIYGLGEKIESEDE